MVRGTTGKVGDNFVYKTRKGKTFISKVPDMSKVVATKQQSENRNIFAEAVQFAKELMQDPVRSAAFARKKDETLYTAAIKEYMRMHGKKSPKDSHSRILCKELAIAGLSQRQINAALFILKTGRLTNDDCRKMNAISKPTATRDLKWMADKEIIQSNGVKGAGSYYIKGSWWTGMGF